MQPFIANILSFPTVVFTVLLGAMMLYWLLVIIGLAGVEGPDADLDLDVGAAPSATGGLAGILASLGLSGVPLSLVASLLILFSWLFCYFTAAYLLPLLPDGPWQSLAGAAALVISLILAIPLTVRLIRPIKGMFVVHHARNNESLIGSRCEIRTLTVSEDFGQALVEDGGAGMIVAVRAKTPNPLKKGDHAIIIDYNQKDVIFQVMPETIPD
jgi:hypothetical protein